MHEQDIAQEKEFLDSYATQAAEINVLYDFLFDEALRTYAPFMSGTHTLELGAGSGLFTQKLLDLSQTVDIVEGSSKICDLLRAARTPKLTVFDSLFETFEPQKKYTDVVASFVNEHVLDTSAVYALARKALLPDGHMLVIVPNRQSLSRQLAKAMGLIDNIEALTPTDHVNGHRRTYDLDSFLQEIEANNFEVKKAGGLLLKPFADFQLTDWLKNGSLQRAHLEGLAKLAPDYPRLCMALYAIVQPAHN